MLKTILYAINTIVSFLYNRGGHRLLHYLFYLLRGLRFNVSTLYLLFLGVFEFIVSQGLNKYRILFLPADKGKPLSSYKLSGTLEKRIK